MHEVINLACEYVYSDTSSSKPKYDKRHFHRLLQFATSGEFLYREKLYRQIDGVAMGSPLGPTLANLFLAHLEQNWLKSKDAPLTYLRYVDDIFCLFDTSSASYEQFLVFLNSQHQNLSFTCDIGPTSLPFLDVQVEVNETGFAVFSIFRKSTYTGLLLNFNAFCPTIWKRALIKCFLRRAYVLCSNMDCFSCWGREASWDILTQWLLPQFLWPYCTNVSFCMFFSKSFPSATTQRWVHIYFAVFWNSFNYIETPIASTL